MKYLGLIVGMLLIAGCNSQQVQTTETVGCTALLAEQAQVTAGTLKLSTNEKTALASAVAVCGVVTTSGTVSP
jgi:uncharacterized lipoprotein YajG